MSTSLGSFSEYEECGGNKAEAKSSMTAFPHGNKSMNNKSGFSEPKSDRNLLDDDYRLRVHHLEIAIVHVWS